MHIAPDTDSRVFAVTLRRCRKIVKAKAIPFFPAGFLKRSVVRRNVPSPTRRRISLIAALTLFVLAAFTHPAFAVSRTLTFNDCPYEQTPLRQDYGADDEISLRWGTGGQASVLITSTGESPFADHSPDGPNRFIFAQGTSVIEFSPTVRLVKVFVRDNEPDFIQNSVSGITVRGELKNVPVFSVVVDFVPSSQSGVWIEVNGEGAIDALHLISTDDLTKSYLIDDLELEIYSDTEVIALAGPNQSILEGSIVTLDGSGSLNAHSFSWTQIPTDDEPQVALLSPNRALTTFPAPDVATATTLTFRLTATGPLGSDTDVVQVIVNISTPPAKPPADLTVVPEEANGSLNASVEWSPHPDAARYVVCRAEGDPQSEYVKVAPSISSTSYEDRWLGEGEIYFYKVAAANQFGMGPASEAVGFVARRNLAFDAGADPMARILKPTGTGVKNIEALRDGVKNQSYDSYHGGIIESEDWYGYLWGQPRYFDTIVYYEGQNFYDGGWWVNLTAHYTSDGKNWTEVEGLTISPPYNFQDERAGRVNYTRFLLRFGRCYGRGIRIYGEPGGIAHFTSVAELEAYGDQAPNIVVADAGPDILQQEGTPVALHGENSLNAEEYLWEQVILNDEPEVSLVGANTSNATFLVQNLEKTTVFTFRLTVMGLHGPKSDTIKVTIVNREVPGPTTGLTAVGGDRKITLSWQPNNDASSYKLLRSTLPQGGGDIIAANITSSSYIDDESGLRPYRTYYYQVVGVNENGEGPPSDVASAIPVENFAMYPDAIAIARVTRPTGTGQKDLNIIRNGVYEEKGYDSYDGLNPAEEDWYGYRWSDPIYPDRVVYTMGRNYLDGGWWTFLTVEYTTDGISWLEAPNVTIAPPYNFENTPAGRPDYSQYTLTFDRVRAAGLRIAGTPGGFAQFTSIVELEVYGLDAPVACKRDIVPLFYLPGETVKINLSVEIHEPPPPDSLSVTELIPQGAVVVDSGGGDTSVPGEIRWDFGAGNVTDKELSYTIAVPADFSGKLSFHGRLSYAGVTDQRIRGEDSLYAKPLPPENLRLEMTLVAHLRWSPVVREGVVGYHVYRSVNGADYQDISGLISQAFFDDLNVEKGASYRYKPTVENEGGVESFLDESQAVGPASVAMLRREMEDYNYEGGRFPGGEGRDGFPASTGSDLSQNKDYFYGDEGASNSYRTSDAIDIRGFPDNGHFIADAAQGDWWRFSFELPEPGFVKIADLRAASSGEATYEFLWDTNLVGKFSFNTGGENIWRTYQMDIPAFAWSAGVHTLRIRVAAGTSHADYFGIGIGWSAPARETIFAEDFDRYVTTDEVVALGNWSGIHESQHPQGAWRLWNTGGEPLEQGEPGPAFPGFSSGFMVSNGDFAGEVQLDEQLISPVIDCTGYICVAVQFASAINIYDKDTDGDLQTTDFEVAFFDGATQSWSDWVNLFTHDRNGGDDFTAIPKSFDISPFADRRKIKLRWRFYNTNNDYWWAVDAVRVTGEKRAPRVTSALATPDGEVSLSWEAFGTGLFTVEYTDDLLSGSWQPVAGTQWPIVTTVWQGDDSSAAKARFYRVKSQ